MAPARTSTPPTTSSKKQHRTVTADEVAQHKTASSCWVVYKGKVYDVTSFLEDHPGGEEYILDHAAQDITDVMADELSHSHSDGAYEMLDDFFVGILASHSKDDNNNTAGARVAEQQDMDGGLRKRTTTDKNIKDNEEDEDKEMAEYLKPTDLVADKKIQFLDLSQPLLWQLWKANYSKAFYLEQVHIPRHLSGPARIFGSPYLEVFTKTPWWAIPLLWGPVIAFNAWRSMEAGLSKHMVAPWMALGIILWTLAEYTIHRFLFHVDQRMPDSNTWLVLHFLLHGIHHYLPMDRLRLVMPPALGVTLAIPLNYLGHTLFPTHIAFAVMSGAFLGYVLYDLTHYYLHHAKVFKIHFKSMKTYHLAHHYKNYEGGYGITSKIWDRQVDLFWEGI
ncbi:fatty acid alpha-hydroxylase [Actinomortierella ambigua]|nr:fatty acid alpha-hydroxylase [Actinomortierella ambigua]